MDAEVCRRSGLLEGITVIWNGLSDGIVVLMHGNACGAKAISQYKYRSVISRFIDHVDRL